MSETMNGTMNERNASLACQVTKGDLSWERTVAVRAYGGEVFGIPDAHVTSVSTISPVKPSERITDRLNGVAWEHGLVSVSVHTIDGDKALVGFPWNLHGLTPGARPLPFNRVWVRKESLKFYT